MEKIYFNSRSKQYREFSNFSKHGMFLNDKYWPTVEHFYQAAKFEIQERSELIRITSSPAEAKRLGRDKGIPIRKDWDSVKETIMFQALKAKFGQHEYLADLLVGTGDAILIENNQYDAYWGCGKNGNGLNRMGMLLMEIREHYRKEQQDSYRGS